MTHVIAADTSKVIHDSAIIKENIIKMVEQLERQDKILEQIAWDHALSSQRSDLTQGKFMMMEKYFESLTEYASSVCGDSVAEDVAEEMSPSLHSSDSSYTRELSPSTLEVTTDLMTLVTGNMHRLVTLPGRSLNSHLWRFYLLASRPEIIEEVKICLVSSFRANFDPQENADKFSPFPAFDLHATRSCI